MFIFRKFIFLASSANHLFLSVFLIILRFFKISFSFKVSSHPWIRMFNCCLDHVYLTYHFGFYTLYLHIEQLIMWFFSNVVSSREHDVFEIKILYCLNKAQVYLWFYVFIPSTVKYLVLRNMHFVIYCMFLIFILF